MPASTSKAELPTPIARHFHGRLSYAPVWAAMRRFTEQRRQSEQADQPDEFWLLEHSPVYTQGSNGAAEHILAAGDIPVVQSDRGGQVTYHGPGQIMAYTLIDLNRIGLGVRSLVTGLENAMISVLDNYGIVARSRPDAPGVYVNNNKIGSIGLRIRHGTSYHGIALNVDMDLEPFSRINPCGYQGLGMTQISELAGPVTVTEVADQLQQALCEALRLPAAVEQAGAQKFFDDAEAPEPRTGS